MSNIEVVSSYPIKCEGLRLKGGLGTPVSQRSVDMQNVADVSIAVYKNGKREVGCPYIGKGPDKGCYKVLRTSNEFEQPDCIHLKPQCNFRGEV